MLKVDLYRCFMFQFDGLSVGADTAITSLVTLVAVTDMLSKVKDKLRNGNVDNVISVLFNGESFDYIGSSRMAYDMMNGILNMF
jgi:nicastrin